jgi:hypothetical protein
LDQGRYRSGVLAGGEPANSLAIITTVKQIKHIAPAHGADIVDGEVVDSMAI